MKKKGYTMAFIHTKIKYILLCMGIYGGIQGVYGAAAMDQDDMFAHLGNDVIRNYTLDTINNQFQQFGVRSLLIDIRSVQDFLSTYPNCHAHPVVRDAKAQLLRNIVIECTVYVNRGYRMRTNTSLFNDPYDMLDFILNDPDLRPSRDMINNNIRYLQNPSRQALISGTSPHRRQDLEGKQGRTITILENSFLQDALCMDEVEA